MKLQGWILDIYPSPQGMTLWLMETNQKRHRLIDRFTPAFYVSGAEESLRRLQFALETKSDAVVCKLTERMDLWEREARIVLEIAVARPAEYSMWARWVHRFDSTLRHYNSDLMLASMYCWEKKIFPFAFVGTDVEEGCVCAIECRDNEWLLDYDLPPLEIMEVRLQGLSRIDPSCRGPAALEIEVDGREYELDESGEPTAEQFRRLLLRHDPDLILADWGDSTMRGVMPEVETVMRRGESAKPCGSSKMRVALITLARFSSGSPWPIMTMLSRPPSCRSRFSLATNSTCPTISPAVRLRSRPSRAVMQNLQSPGHPTWLEIQMVSRSPSGMSTVSTVRPSSSRKR